MENIKNEIFEKYQVRKTKAQKAAFRDYVKGRAEEEGYSASFERGSLGCQTIVVGDPLSAEVV